MDPEKNGSVSAFRRRRLAADISLRKMARRVGVSPTYLSMVERGLTIPSDQRAARIERFLGKVNQRRL